MAEGGGTLSVAVIGSSGGGTATLGHTDPSTLLKTIHHELCSVQNKKENNSREPAAELSHALFVSLDGGKGMDSVDDKVDTASLYQVNCGLNNNNDNIDRFSTHCRADLSCRVVKRGVLQHVNNYCREQDEIIAQSIQDGKIHGLICISCHIGIFEKSLRAAASKKIPITGSGGTSLSQAAKVFGIHLVGNAGGSVATTSFTRAVSYTHALASHYGKVYQPWKKQRQFSSLSSNDSSNQGGPSSSSVLKACLPAFWGVCLVNHVLKKANHILSNINHSWVSPDVHHIIELSAYGLENWALPTVCAIVMATSRAAPPAAAEERSSTSSLVMASTVASVSCSQSILTGLMAGWLVSCWSERLLFWCIFNHIPATMTSMIIGGGLGTIVALVVLPIAPLLRQLTAFIRWSILWTVTMKERRLRMGAGFVWGCLSCFGSKVGWYHAVHLPLILVEMETGKASFFGAVDELTLVLVCAGICASKLTVAALFSTKSGRVSDSDVALCRRGLCINLSCGDFIEVCYPYMERDIIINLGGYLASGLATAWLVASAQSVVEVPSSLAYLPLPVSILLAEQQWRIMVEASLIAIFISFAATLLSHLLMPTLPR